MSRERTQTLDQIRQQPNIPILIVGGGINGAGLLRELALQGVDALLVEKGDYCSGASAASTRVIHGGLRYLENFELRLVRESLHERNRLIRNAPHSVRPLPTTIPIFNRTGGITHIVKKFLRIPSKPGGRGALVVKIGLTLYDFLTRSERVLPTHRFTNRRDALALRPELNPDIYCTATYYDASIAYPERLCLELILDARASGGRALNYVSLAGADGGSVTLRDEISGETLTIKRQIVVNATGAWIDFTNRALKRESRFIGGTKGSHLVIDHPALLEATQQQMLYFENADGRICIFYRVFDRVIAGSTDIPITDPEQAICDDDEADYILASIRQVFPNIKVDRSHVVYRFCGVRPLPRSDAVTTGQISRDHSAPLTPPGNGIDFPIYSLIGGKWTTFRAFAEQVADDLLPLLKQTRRTRSDDLAIGGGKDYPEDTAVWIVEVAQKNQLSHERVAALFERYGTRANEIAAYLSAAPDRTLRSHADYSEREIRFMIECEDAEHVEDIILRRTLLALLGQLSFDLIAELASILAESLGWSAEQIEQEIARTLDLLETRAGVKLSP
ncbi:MAG: glycerol-3-phosphate dehydrogenase/oxidase [Chloroflexota bacterium]